MKKALFLLILSGGILLASRVRAQVKLAGGTLTNVSSVPIVISSYISNYDVFEVYFYGVTISNDGTGLLLQTSSNGTSYDNGSGNYAWNWENFDDAQSNASDVSMEVTGDIGNATGKSLSGKVYIFSPNSSSFFPLVPGEAAFVGNGANSYAEHSVTAGVRLAQQKTQAIQFSLTTGTFTTFTYKVIGYAN